MPAYKSEDFLTIYSKIIRPGATLPFDCFVLLQLSQRVSLFLSAGIIISDFKIEKLKTFSHDKLYIRKQDQELYLNYVKNFAEQAGNKQTIVEDLGQGVSPEDLGLPAEITSTLTPSSVLTIKDDIEPSLGAVLQVLQNETHSLQKEIQLSQALPPEEKEILKNVSLKIEEELQSISSHLDADLFQKKILGVTEHIQNEMIRVSSSSKWTNENKSYYKKMIESLNKDIAQLSSSQTEEALQENKIRIQSQIKIIKSIASPQKEELVSGAIENIISSIENKLGTPLNLKITSEKITTEHLLGTGKADPQLIEKLKEVIAKQEKITQDLTEKIKASIPSFEDLRNRWFTFQMMIKRKIDASDQMKTKSITQQFYDFESSFFAGLNLERKNLKKITHQLNFVVTGDLLSAKQMQNLSDDPDELAISGGISASPSEDGFDSENSSESQTPTSQGGDLAEMDRLLAENNVLKVQIENAQALIETTTKKTNELEEMLRSDGEYVESLEGDLMQTKKKLEEALSSSQDYEFDKRRLSEGLEDMGTNLYRQKTDLTAEEAKSHLLQTRVLELEKTVKLYNEKLGKTPEEVTPESMKDWPQDLHFVLQEKDAAIKNLNKKLSHEISQLTQAKKDLENLRSEDRKFDLERKDLSKRIETQRLESENMKQLQKTLEIKGTTTTNLLTQARKTINKLTEENSELRQDRTKYIRKTNDALAEHKSLISQALHMHGQIQLEVEKNKTLENQLESSKGKEKEQQRQNQAQIVLINKLEAEKKKLDSDFKKASAGDRQAEIDQLKEYIQGLEKKLEHIKKDNKHVHAQLAQEQKKHQAEKKKVS